MELIIELRIQNFIKRNYNEPGILGGKPVVRGIRIGVNTILYDLACSYTFEQILKEKPLL